MTTRFGLMTYNPGAGLRATLVPFLLKHRKRMTLVALQESGKYHPIVSAALKLAGYDSNNSWPQVPTYHQTARVTAEFVGKWWLSNKTLVGSAGAGPKYMNEKWANVTRLRFKNGRVVWLVNFHAVPSIQVRLQRGAERSRDDLHEQQMGRVAELVNLLRAGGEEVLVVGDFNAQWGHANLDVLREAGLSLLNPRGATHGKRTIDLVLGTPGIITTGGQVIPGLNPKDHNLVTVDLELLDSLPPVV